MAKRQAPCYNARMPSLLDNRKALFSYEPLETLEAGLELLGYEVKALRAGKGSLAGSYVTIRGGEAFLVGATISPYQAGNVPKEYEPTRNRRLLLAKKELSRLAGATERDGLTIVPISVYNKGSLIKIELALAKGKKKHDKRQSIKKRETDREIDRTLKNYRD